MHYLLKGLAWVVGVIGTIFSLWVFVMAEGGFRGGLFFLLITIIIVAILAALAYLIELAEYNTDRLTALERELLPSPTARRPVSSNSCMKSLDKIKDYTFKAGD